MMMKLQAIAELTFKKVKEPAVAMLILVSALLGIVIASMNSNGPETGSETQKLLMMGQSGETGVSSIIICISAIIAILSGSTEIPRDIEARTIMFILGKPVQRFEYLLGKFLGLYLICILFYIATITSAMVTAWVRGGEPPTAETVSRSLMGILSLAPFLSLSFMVSCFMPDISAMIISTVYVIFCLAMGTTIFLVDMLPQNMLNDFWLFLLYYYFPNLLYFLQSFSLLSVEGLSLILYSLSVTFIFITIGAYRLQSKDLS